VTNAAVKPQTSSLHLLGTCRMGNDPAKSVIDRYHRTHDIPNLFISDGSAFTSPGSANPTLTIVALALRQADFIGKQMAARAL